MSRGSSSYRSICCGRSAANPPLLLSIDGTDGRTDGRTGFKNQLGKLRNDPMNFFMDK